MKNKLLKWLRNNKWLFITFLCSLITISVIYTIKKIAPFGNNSMLDVDFYHQYGPLLNELTDRVKSGRSLLYSFNTGLGMPFYRNFLNYLSSPFNLILLLFKKQDIVMAYSIIIGLKACLSSVSMAYYLKKSFKKDGPLLIVFGLLYAFSGYFCAYYWNIMWLDGMVFLPIIMYGINKIIDEEKPILYIISLAIMLLANYFIGYMVCIFSVFYFLGLFIYRKNFKLKNIIKKFLMFFISSVLAAGIVAFLLLPLFYSLKSISATGDSFPMFQFNFNAIKYIFNHVTAVNRTVFASDKLPLPNVYPGMISLALIIILFINKKINLRFKIISLIAILFFYFCFNINVIDFIWHAFHVPNDLPYRYSFLYTFCLVVIAYYSFLRIKEVSFLKISICFAILVVIVLLSIKLDFANIDEKRAIVDILLLTLDYIVITLYINSKNKILSYLLVIISMLECIYGISINWQIDHDIAAFMSDKKGITSLISKIKKDDNDLYRIEKTDYLTLNDGAWYDYNGVSTFSSMAYENVSKTQRMLGMAGNNINSYYYKNAQSPVYNTLFNIRYLIGDNVNNDFYLTTNNLTGNTLSYYKYSSSIGFLVDKDVYKAKLDEYKPFENQTNLINKMTNIDNIYKKVSIKEIHNGTLSDNHNNEYYYEVSSSSNNMEIILNNKLHDNIYLYIKSNDLESYNVDEKYYSITSDEYYILDIGTSNSDEVKITLNLKENKAGYLTFCAYYIDKDKFIEFYNYIKENMMHIDKYNDTYITGRIISKDNNTLFLSIPYDEGWNAFVDGKKVKTKKILDSYLALNMKKGYHKVELKYYPKMMKEGLIITGLSYVLIFVYILLNNSKKNKKAKKDKFIV